VLKVFKEMFFLESIPAEEREMTYDSGWLIRRVSAAAHEYEKWTPSLKKSMKLTPNTTVMEANKEQRESLSNSQ
jgi:hypothetical protein